jgi:predicted lipoprotein with Yx(FWY)xxD motif
MDVRRPGFVPAFFTGAGALFAIFTLALFLSGGPDRTPASAAAGSPVTGAPGTTAAAGSPVTGATGTTTTESDAPAPVPAAVRMGASDYGPILFDARGRALYAFTSDPSGKSVCTGDCAAAWPPYLARGRLRAGKGAKQTLLGSVKRPEGTLQVAYGGRALYYFVGDREPGQVLCQGVVEFGGTWLVVRASGSLVQ